MASTWSVPDRLAGYFSDSEFAEGIRQQIEDNGYIVLPGVLSASEADTEYGRMWQYVERVSKGVQRTQPNTWRRGGGFDPWPCSQRDMMQLYQAGWVFSELREMLAERVFEHLYGTRELHTSKDGFTLQRPTERELGRSPNDHFDQGAGMQGLQCIQGSVALTDQEIDDGCFLCWPGSHRHHAELVGARGSKGRRSDFVILDDREKDFLMQHGIQPQRIPVQKGDVILWRSDVAHKGAPPVGARENFRGVVYICMLPAALTPEEVYVEKQQAFQSLETGSHWPCREEWFTPRSPPRFALRPYFNKSPVLTPRQRLLYGLDRYVATQLPTRLPPPTCERASNLFRVVRVAVKSQELRGAAKWTNPLKAETPGLLHVGLDGVQGDYNHYRTAHKASTRDRAVSLVTLDMLASLQNDGFGIRAGDLGENLTLEGHGAELSPGMRLRVEQEAGTAAAALEVEISEPMIPCRNLEHIDALASLRDNERRAFPRACQGRRGWYARVLVAGDIQRDSLLQVVPLERNADVSPALDNKSHRDQNLASGRARGRRWQRKDATA